MSFKLKENFRGHSNGLPLPPRHPPNQTGRTCNRQHHQGTPPTRNLSHSSTYQQNPLRDSADIDQHHPLTFIQDLIMRETHKHQLQPNHQTILLGDLNSSWLDTTKVARILPYTDGLTGRVGRTPAAPSLTKTQTPEYAPTGSRPSPGSTTSLSSNPRPCQAS